MKKMILVNQVTGPMCIDLANYYRKVGFNVHLMTGVVEETGQSLHESIEIIKYVTYRRRNPVLRIITWMIFFFQAYHGLKKEKKQAVVMLVSNPPFAPLLSHFLNKKKNLLFRTLIYDIYPDVLERAGYFSRKSWLTKLWRKLNVKAYQRASHIYTISDGMKHVLSQYAPEDRWQVIYPWVDTTFIKPIHKKDNPFVKKYKLEDKTVILYSGNMGATHDLMTILQVSKELNGQANILFVFIGDGSEKKRMMAFADKHNLQNTLFLPFQKPEVLPYSLTAADIGIVTLTGAASQLSVPSKTFYQMAAGNAILCMAEKDSELARLILKHNCGMVCTPKSVNYLTSKLNLLDKNKITEWATNARIASSKYNVDNINMFSR